MVDPKFGDSSASEGLDFALLEALFTLKGGIEAVREALNRGADVNCLNKYGESALMVAVQGYCDDPDAAIEAVRLLIERGADVNYLDADDCGALDYSVFSHDPRLIELLLAAGANPNIIHERLDSVLDLADVDRQYHRLEGELDRVAALEKIIDLLKAAGARFSTEMIAERPNRWLLVSANSPAGLLTRDGILDCLKLSGATPELSERLKKWVKNAYIRPSIRCRPIPPGYDEAAHTREG